MNKDKWFLNGGRGSGRSFRLLWEAYENKIAELEKENAELKAQVEQMKCCGNCRWEQPCSFCDDCKRLEGQIFSDILTSDNWELKEIEK